MTGIVSIPCSALKSRLVDVMDSSSAAEEGVEARPVVIFARPNGDLCAMGCVRRQRALKLAPK